MALPQALSPAIAETPAWCCRVYNNWEAVARAIRAGRTGRRELKASMQEGEKKYKEGISYGLWAGWLFGFAGLHRLYLGKYGTGFLWLFTWGLGGIGQLYDLITMRRQVEEANLLEEVRAMKVARHRDPDMTPQQMLLSAALKEGGQLTVTQAAMITGYTFQEAEQLLRDMVASGYVDIGNEPESGVIVYYFPELKATRRLRSELDEV